MNGAPMNRKDRRRAAAQAQAVAQSTRAQVNNHTRHNLHVACGFVTQGDITTFVVNIHEGQAEQEVIEHEQPDASGASGELGPAAGETAGGDSNSG